MIIIRQFIHNARNRLMTLGGHFEAQGDNQHADEIQRIGGLLSSAMALLKLETDSETLSVQEIDLDFFFTDLKTQIQTLSPKNRKTTCTADFSQCVFPIWTFDEELVRMVIIDALMNAWRHAKHTVQLSACWDNGDLIFRIQDDGPGYPKHILDTQGKNPVAGHLPGTEQAGTGHGLFLAHQIAEKHRLSGKHGSIHLTNLEAPQHGGIFELRLP